MREEGERKEQEGGEKADQESSQRPRDQERALAEMVGRYRKGKLGEGSGKRTWSFRTPATLIADVVSICRTQMMVCKH